MCLTDLRRGQSVEVLDIPDGDVRMQLLRFGITAGTKVRCHAKVPFGPVVLRYGGQEIALGRELASSISVKNAA